jgi:hypothetical protein
MRRAKLILVAGMFLAAVSTPVWADTPARPGTVNYVEGQAATGGQSLDAKSVGVELGEGQSITTLNGKAEILLTPGVFLRLGPNSSAKLVAAGLADTQVQLDQGHAMIEVDQIFPENHLRVLQGGFAIDLQKKGLYDFDANEHQVRIFDGEAVTTNGSHRIEWKSGHELNLAATGDLKAHGFDKKNFEGDLYNWSRLRSSYLAEANIGQARTYVSGPGFWGAGWYWNPWYSAYTFIPGDGFFYNPFGWGFYSPFFVARAPFFGFYGGGYRTFVHYAPPAAFVGGYHGVVGYRAGVPAGSYRSAAPAFRGGFSGGGGFHGGRR